MTATMWCVVIIRASGEEIDPLTTLYPSEAEARAYADRCCGWYTMVKVRTVPVVIDAALGTEIVTGRDVRDCLNL
jgi:hypothetical protein